MTQLGDRGMDAIVAQLEMIVQRYVAPVVVERHMALDRRIDELEARVRGLERDAESTD